MEGCGGVRIATRRTRSASASRLNGLARGGLRQRGAGEDVVGGAVAA